MDVKRRMREKKPRTADSRMKESVAERVPDLPVNWSRCVKRNANSKRLRGVGVLAVSGRSAAGGFGVSFGEEDPHGCFLNGWSCR